MVIIQIRFLTNPFCAFQIHNLFVAKIMVIIHIRFLAQRYDDLSLFQNFMAKPE